MDKICNICGKPYQSDSVSSKYCSHNCRKAAIRMRYNPVGARCRTCGSALADGRQWWCLDCLLRDYKRNKSAQAYHRLENRGYTKESIILEIKKRGIT